MTFILLLYYFLSYVLDMAQPFSQIDPFMTSPTGDINRQIISQESQQPEKTAPLRCFFSVLQLTTESSSLVFMLGWK